MRLIINLRGTSGSGKTSVARGFMNNYPHETLRNAKGKALGTRVDVTELQHPLFLVGKYDNTCGGMDTIETQELAAQRAIAAYGIGHVLCEGLLASGVGPGGTFPRMLIEAAGRAAVFAFLDTPLEVCIERVKARRAAAGNTKEFNTLNTERKFNQVVSSFQKYVEAQQSALWIDHTNAYAEVFNLLREAENNA